MIGRMNSKKLVKAMSIGLSLYIAISPVVVYANGLSDAENALAAQVEVREEAAASVEQAVENAAIPESQVDFENMEIVADIPAANTNTLEDTSALVKEEISRIENEAIREAADAIVNVDMSNVDDALDKVTELVDSTLTDEAVADEIEATADALISLYDAQAEAALNALKTISEEMDAVTVSADGSVAIDWNAATSEVTDLYNAYQTALAAKETAQNAKNEIADKKTAAADKVNELNNGVIKNKEEISEAINASKQDKNNVINELISEVAELKSKDIKKEFTYDQIIPGSSDMYRFYINTVEDGIAYGCLTYYDAEKNIILRKNFKISSDGIDYNYIPKSEWVKGDKNCKQIVFGNGGNYIAAYVDGKISDYITGGKTFNGPNVSNIMRANVDLNNAIDARNQALIDLDEINKALDEAEENLKNASDNADDALSVYKEAVEMYKEAAELEGEIKKDEVEKAKLEYVKAEVEVWRKQQALDRVKKALHNTSSYDDVEVDIAESQASIDTVVNDIANNLGVNPDSIETLVAQMIADTDNGYNAAAGNGEESAVLGVRRDKAENIKDAELLAEEEVADDVDTQYVSKEIVTIEDNEVPLAATVGEVGYSMNWWWLLAVAILCLTIVMYIADKKKDSERN